MPRGRVQTPPQPGVPSRRNMNKEQIDAHSHQHCVRFPRWRRRAPGGEPGYRNSGWTFKDIEFREEAYALKGEEQVEATAMMLGSELRGVQRRLADHDGGVRGL